MDLTEIRNTISLIQLNADSVPIECSKDGLIWYLFRGYVLDLENFKYRVKDIKLSKIEDYLIKKDIYKDIINVEIISCDSFVVKIKNKNIY